MTPELEAVVRGADRDRMLGRRAALQPLNRQQAHQLIQARLATVPELSGLQTIDERDLKELFAEDGTCVARKIIVRCRELFDAWLQNPAPPPEKPADVLAHKLQDLQRTPRIADAEGILRTALPTVLYLRGINPTPPPRPNSTLDAILPGQKPSALAIANQQPGIPLIRRLERIQADWQSSAAPSLLILRDARNGISVTAKRSRETVAHLESAGARIVSVAAEALSVLEAICRLLADARSGDLTHRGAAIPAATVESWLRDHMPRPVDELLDQIGGDRTVAPDNLALMLTDLLAQSKVVSLEDAALQLAATPQEVEDCAGRHPSLVGFAGGNKRVLFRIVEAQAGDNRE
jgi:hypothetical protein